MHRKVYFSLVFLLAGGFVSGENRTVYYNATGIIVNHNYTENFLENDCRPCQDLSADLETGINEMLDFFEKFRIYRPSENTNRSIQGVFFSSPTRNTRDYGIPLEERKKAHVSESGVFFIVVLRFDFEVKNPAQDWPGLKIKIVNSVWQYLIMVAHFQLHHNVLLNDTSFSFMEILEDQIDDYLKILRSKWTFTPNVANPGVHISKVHREILEVISFVGCGLSALGLVATLFTIIMFRKIRKLQANQIMAHLCVAYLGAILMFLLNSPSVNVKHSLDLCRGMAAMMHYFLLSSVTWMTIEAYNLYQDLVKVFDTSHLSQTEFMCRAGVIGWVVPGVIVVITSLSALDSYGFHTTEEDEHFICWLKGDAFYGAFLAPILLLTLINMCVFVIVMKEIYKTPRHHAEKANRLGQFRATVAVSSLLGLNWVLAGLAATNDNLVLQYLFTVTCSCQGFFIFLFHGIVKKDFREAWKRFSTNNRVMQVFSSSLASKTTSAILSQPNNHRASFDVATSEGSGVKIQVPNNQISVIIQ